MLMASLKSHLPRGWKPPAPGNCHWSGLIHADTAKHGRIGESIAGVAAQRKVIWPTPEQFKALERPKPVMTPETRARLQATSKRPPDNGDPVAVMLREAATLDDAYRIAAKYLSVPEAQLRKQYGHLNPGQQRMNCGNRMRGKWRNEHPDEVKAKKGAAPKVAAVVAKTVKTRPTGIRSRPLPKRRKK